jgi:hypothetical protein
MIFFGGGGTGFELRAYTLSHSTSPFFVKFFFFFLKRLANCLPGLASNCDAS